MRVCSVLTGPRNPAKSPRLIVFSWAAQSTQCALIEASFNFNFNFRRRGPWRRGRALGRSRGTTSKHGAVQHEFGKLVCLAADEAIAVSSHLMNMQDHACGGDCAQEDDEICGSGWCSGSGSSSSLSSSGPRGVSIPSLLAAGSSLRRSTVAARRVRP